MTRNSRHWAIAAAAFLAAAPVLAGCGAGSDAITNKPYSPTEALTAKVRGIAISQAFFLGPDAGSQLPAGGATPLYLSLVNTNQRVDRLLGLGVDPALGTAKVVSPVDLPIEKRVGVGNPTPTIVIEGLKKPLRGGESIAVQLQFANAGVIPLKIPVITRSREYRDLPQAPASTPESSASASPAATASSEPTASATPSPSASGSQGESGH